MRNEELVTKCYGQARALGHDFARAHNFPDVDEWISLACFQLVMAALKFTPPPDHRGGAFWSFARKFIWNRLTDNLRVTSKRGRCKLGPLETSTPDPERFCDRSNAAIVIGYAQPFLTKGQRKVIGAVMVYGIDSVGAAAEMGMKLSAFRKQRHEALKRMREVLS